MKTVLKDNVKMKIFAVIFAFFMWIYVMAEVDPIIIRDIDSAPISITNSQELELLELTPSYGTDLNVRVSLRGRRSILNSQINKGIVVEGLIENPTQGENKLDIEVVNLDTNLEYTLYPNDKKVNLEKNLVVRKSVSVVQSGSLPENFEIKEIKLNPASMFIQGPKSLVDSIVTLQTSLDVSDYEKDFSKKLLIIPVDKDNQEVKGVSINQDSVFAHAIVVKTKTVPASLNLPTNESQELILSGYSLEPTEIVIKGKPSIIDSINEIKTEVVNLESLIDTPSIKIKLLLPTGVETESLEITLKSTMEKVITKEFNISKERIEISGNGQMPDISENTNVPENVTVNITATEKVINSIKQEDIRLFVEMQDYINNPANVELKVEVDKEVKSIEIKPLYLNLQR